jgi:hypothetical protein
LLYHKEAEGETDVAWNVTQPKLCHHQEGVGSGATKGVGWPEVSPESVFGFLNFTSV